MKRIFILLSIFIPLLALAITPDQVENVHRADRTRYVTDQAGVLSPEALAQADAILADIWKASSAEAVAVIVPDISGAEINDYATELFSLWGIGKNDKDNGILVLISVGDRKAVIRTGYGAEGVLPDVLASRIIRNDMAPEFREGNYSEGVLKALSSLRTITTDPEAREELMSEHANDEGADDSGSNLFVLYLLMAVITGVAMLVFVIIASVRSRRLPTAQRYKALQQWRLPALVVACLSLGCALPAYLLLIYLMRRTRLRKRLCPHCHTRMERVDEVNDNRYLTPSQDAEERLDSVDYDVWLCPSCGETDIIPYINTQRNYEECPVCHARAMVCTGKRILSQPTTLREGHGVYTYHCLNCGHDQNRPFTLPKVVAAPIIIGGGGGNGFGGGGGFSGGSFGGGMTGGGGASGGW